MTAPTSPQCFLDALAADPADWHARLAYADWLSESGAESRAHYQRGRAWLWAFVESVPHMRLCFVEGRGRGTLVAYFSPGDPAQRRGRDWDATPYFPEAQPPEEQSLRVRFESPGHDVPADVGRQRLRNRLSVNAINSGACAWLLPTRYEIDDSPQGEPVMAGATVVQFARAVEAARGWWGICCEMPL